MDGKKLSPQELIESLRQEVEQTLSQVAEAVNSVPDGHVIRGSEHQVKDLMDRLRSRVFEQVLLVGCIIDSRSIMANISPYLAINLK